VLVDEDPLCKSNVASTCADIATCAGCRSGYRDAQQTCATDVGCLTATVALQDDSFEVSICALEPALDPNCKDDTLNGQSAYCDGLVLVSCFGGYVVQRDECAPGSTPSGDDPCFDHGERSRSRRR